MGFEPYFPDHERTSRKLQTHADYYERQFLKFPQRAGVHSYAELLQAALYEGNPSVKYYIPQPTQILGWYHPDFYVIENGHAYLIELKPRGEFDEQKRQQIQEFASEHNMAFKVLSNESVYAERMLAENWLMMLELLVLSRHCKTDSLEVSVVQTLEQGGRTLGELCQYREEQDERLLAVFRLLHKGFIRASLSQKLIDWDTEVFLP